MPDLASRIPSPLGRPPTGNSRAARAGAVLWLAPLAPILLLTRRAQRKLTQAMSLLLGSRAAGSLAPILVGVLVGVRSSANLLLLEALTQLCIRCTAAAYVAAAAERPLGQKRRASSVLLSRRMSKAPCPCRLLRLARMRRSARPCHRLRCGAACRCCGCADLQRLRRSQRL